MRMPDRFLRGPFFIIVAAALFVAIVFLTSCATVEPPRQPQVTSGIRAEVEKVEVVKPCIYTDEIPKAPGTWMSESQSKEKRRLASVADYKQLEEYLLKVDALLIGCAKPREAGK